VPDDSPLLLTGTTSRAAAIRRWITRTFAGRALALGAIVKVVALVLGLFARGATFVVVIDTLADICLVSGAAVMGWRMFHDARRLILWRVRRKLTISYIFIGFVPALLIIAFFLLGGWILLINMGTYMVKTRFDTVVEQAHLFADSTALELQQARDEGDVAAVLQRRHAAAVTRYPQASFAALPASCDRASAGGAPAGDAAVVRAGEWTHTTPPRRISPWVPCEGYAGLIFYVVDGQPRRLARSVSWLPGAQPRAVVVDLPLDASIVAQIRGATGVTVNGIAEAADGADQGGWPAFIDFQNWETGEPEPLPFAIRLSFADFYNRISETSSARLQGEFSFGQTMLLMLTIIGGLFLIIQGVAFLMGLGLARSITGAIHELFIGTERVRRGDFSHRIAIHTRDQLGELSMLFNTMTDSIEDLLQEKAEKERLEQELRIARQIQMSLLPQSTFSRPGLGLMAHCAPAREVGGDYYDFLPVGDALGILIADVSGKGTSAALYMAELKGLMLALSQVHTSPRQLLIDANRIISQHLDSRSFITVSYVLVDPIARTLQYARAGHCPMVYIPGPYAISRTPRLLAPDGMVLGLTIDDGTMFNRLLEEVTLPIGPGDLFLLYTDGMSEAMNPGGDCFGDDRLATVLSEYADLPSDELLARILEQVTEFAGSADQQDDMTMVLIRVEEAGVVSVVS
jgi:sigma-B regulation protein RsbU (phosphoserine phosphatase)